MILPSATRRFSIPSPVRRAGRASHGSWSGIRSRKRPPQRIRLSPKKNQNHAYTEETVAVYPGDKNNLPYDVEIRTLRFDEPEHDPPSAEPAEPEPPAMSEEEALLLEQEGRAALSEMGEFVPDFDDAISQAEDRRSLPHTVLRYPSPLTASGRNFTALPLRSRPLTLTSRRQATATRRISTSPMMPSASAAQRPNFGQIWLQSIF